MRAGTNGSKMSELLLHEALPWKCSVKDNSVESALKLSPRLAKLSDLYHYSQSQLDEAVDNRLLSRHTDALDASRKQIDNHVSPMRKTDFSQFRAQYVLFHPRNHLSLSETIVQRARAPRAPRCRQFHYTKPPLPGHFQSALSGYHSAVYGYNGGFTGSGDLTGEI
ncbi:hypothetical protein PABG_12563 [Paracoccidioides brasiliensis Pb03]|nr:hypothetical protein PABG_12563 [Paracoccidioides brasiliensis Pb03]